jgi:hypothetical protein
MSIPLNISCDGDNGSGNELTNESVVFLGASITEGFNLPGRFPGYNFHIVCEYSEDKSPVYGECMSYDPEIIVIKECGAYFWHDAYGFDIVQGFMIDAMEYFDGQGVIVVPATTLPIDVGTDVYNTVIRRDNIINYNNWLRGYASDNGYTVMEYFNTIADGDGELPPEYHTGDGLHPNNAGYDVLEPIVIPTLETALPITGSSLGEIKALFD